MGAIFRVKVLESENLAETIKEIQKHKFTVLATDLKESKSIYEESYNKTAVVIGNEANGVEEEILELADRKIKIPMLRKNRKLKCFCCNRNNNL